MNMWLAICHMDKEHFGLLLNSVRKVFPYVPIWIATTEALLTGSRQELNIIDYGKLQKWKAMPKMRERLAKVEVLSS